MKHLLPNVVVILLVIKSGKSMFVISVPYEGIVRRCRAFYDYERTNLNQGVSYRDITLN